MPIAVTNTERPTEASGLLASDEAVGNTKTVAANSHRGARAFLVVEHVRIDYTSTATAGTRTLRLQVKEGSTVLKSRVLKAETNLVASQNKKVAVVFRQPYAPLGGEYVDPPDADNEPVVLKAGQTIVVEDTANVAAGDTCKVYLYGKRTY